MTPTWDDLQNRAQPLADGDGAPQAGRVARRRREAAMNVALPPDQRAPSSKEMPDASQSFHERFLAKHLVPAPRPQGAIGSATAVHDADPGADGHGRPRAADRVRERREPAAGARRRAAEGGGDPPGARRRARRDRAPAPGREPGARPASARCSASASRGGPAALLLTMLPDRRRRRRRCRRRPTCASSRSRSRRRC